MAYFHTTVLDEQIKALPTVDTASGSIATFDTDMTENLVEVECQIVAQQSGSGTPSPSNPRPITTYSEMNVGLNGFNLIAKQALMQRVKLKTGDTIYFRLFNSNINFRLYGVTPDKDPTNLSNWEEIDTVTGQTLRSKTLSKNYGYIGISSGAYSDLGAGDIQVSLSSFDTFTPYNGTTANIPFGQTVAQGLLNVGTGKLRVTHGYVDLGSLNWTNFLGGSIKMIYMSFPDCPTPPDNITRASLICSNMPTKSRSEIGYAEPYNDGIGIDSVGNLFVAYPSGTWTDITSAKNGLSGWYMCYELATPIEIQLDSTQITALLNENNIWCDTGDTEVKYLLTVGKKIA